MLGEHFEYDNAVPARCKPRLMILTVFWEQPWRFGDGRTKNLSKKVSSVFRVIEHRWRLTSPQTCVCREGGLAVNLYFCTKNQPC